MGRFTLGSLLLLLVGLVFVSAKDYDCSAQYQGKCFDCFYNANICHRAGPSVIYKNGVIYTVDKQNSPNWSENPMEAFLVENGKIVKVGYNEDILPLAKSGVTRIVDLKGKTVLPGIHDTHQHPMEASSALTGTCMLHQDLMPTDPKQLESFENGCYENQKATDWVLGWGHSVWTLLKYVEDTGLDPKDILDEYIPDKPAVMLEFTSHSAWANSKALEVAGITKDTPHIKHGSIYMRNNVTQEPNGILLENAAIGMFEMALNPEKYPEMHKYNVEACKNALFTLAQNGITSVVDARSFWQREHQKAWEEVAKENKITVKAVLSMWAYPELEDKMQLPILKAFFSNDKNSRLRKSQIKVYMDGLLCTRTAKLLEPYTMDYPDLGIGDYGMNYFTQERLATYLKELQNIDGGEGFDFLIHQIGDGAAREALNAIEETKPLAKIPTRHKLSHMEIVHPDDIPRFKKMGVLADMQVAGQFTMPNSLAHADLEKYIGKARAKDDIPVRSLQESGASVTLSSDWDVSTLNPFVGMQNAISRGHQSVDLKSALEMYTVNGAFSMRQEDRTGCLAPGKDADFIVVDQDIFNLEMEAPQRIKNTKVLMTVLEGEEILVKPL